MRSRPLGVIDIGSNTIRSLIVQPLSDGGYRVLDDERDVARLASGLDRRGRLSPAAIARAVKALRRMAQIARARGAHRLSVVATSAIRNAANKSVFLTRVQRQTGLRVRIVSGPEEARLAFESAALSFDLADRPCAVADVGGGSTEVVLALGGHIQHVYSLPLGTVALTERYLRSDRVRWREFKELRSHVRRCLRATSPAADPAPQYLIGSGGTASCLAQVATALQGLPGRSVHGYELTQAQILHLRDALLRRTLAERRRMPGLSADRADIIIAGVTILYEILAQLKVNTLRVSTHGIRHAILHRLMTRQPASALRPARPQRLAAAASLARSLRFEQKHGEHVQRIALSLYDQLADPLRLDPSSRDLLGAAALLHDVGYVVSFRQHHKHAYHLISHAQMDGFTSTEREIIALVARYHRRSPPRKKHAAWAGLPREERELVRRLSALLRLADALDRRHSQKLADVACRLTRRRLTLTLVSPADLSVEIHAAEEKAAMFEEVFGLTLAFATTRGRRIRATPDSRRAVAARRASA